MLSAARITATLAITKTCPRAAAAAVGSRNMVGFPDTIKSKEKVEEERYIRQIEHEAYLKRRAKEVAAAEAKERDDAQKAHDEAMHDTIDELFGVLAKTGDKISDMGVENLALWKLGKN